MCAGMLGFFLLLSMCKIVWNLGHEAAWGPWLCPDCSGCWEQAFPQLLWSVFLEHCKPMREYVRVHPIIYWEEAPEKGGKRNSACLIWSRLGKFVIPEVQLLKRMQCAANGWIVLRRGELRLWTGCHFLLPGAGCPVVFSLPFQLQPSRIG